ncbi:MAG: single-stranded DNA-binding protein [Bacteroidetes bacterium]|nr:single-stranded DNA-binding protein [Bacteroidota bacterium]
MLKLIAIGNLGGDAEVRDLPSGQKVISFSVAHTEKFTDRNNQLQERTTWVRCSYFRPSDRVAVAQYLTKGTQVYVEGTPDARGYTTRDGQQGVSLELNVRDLQLLGTRGSGGGEGGGMSASSTRPAGGGYGNMPAASSSAPEPLPPVSEEDDLPF